MPNYVIPEHHKPLLNGVGMRIANWQVENHHEDWTDEDDQAVVERAEENSESLATFAEKLGEDIRGDQAH